MNHFFVDVNIRDTGFFPTMKGYGSMIEDIFNFQYHFQSGKIYGIVGECGAGGWGVSSVLCGKEFNTNCKILIDNRSVSQKELKEFGWYVGEGTENVRYTRRERSVQKQLEMGVKESGKESVESIVRKFHLSENRLSMKLSVLSWEKWRASAAIGYAYDRKVFCFPWVNTRQLSELITNSRLDIFSDILKKEGNIVIIPTEKREIVELIADEIIELNNSRHMLSSLVKELVEDYRSSQTCRK